MTTRLFKDKSVAEVNRMTQFAFQAPTARQVSLAGDFNNWDDAKAEPRNVAKRVLPRELDDLPVYQAG